MSYAFFIISELCYCYILCKGMRAIAGRRKTGLLVEMISYIGVTITISVVYQLWNIPVITMLFNLLGFFALSFNYEGAVFNRIFQSCLIYVLLVVAETLAMILTKQAAMKAVEQNEISFDNTLMILARLFQLLFVLMIEKVVKNKEQRKISLLQISVFFMFVSGSIYLETVLFQELQGHKPELLMITNIVILLLNIAVIWTYDLVGDWYQEKEKASLLQIKNTVYKNELELMKEREASIRMLRHDMKNHCLILREQLRKEEIHEAETYLDKLLINTDTKGIWIQTGNSEIDSFINYKFAEAQKCNITCLVQAKIPENLKIDEFLIACILGNLLDNAIAAAKETQNPQIKVVLSYIKKNLYLEIINSYQGELLYRNGRLETKKNNKTMHGYGLQSVEQQVKQCHH